jgi:hypothetical protein
MSCLARITDPSSSVIANSFSSRSILVELDRQAACERAGQRVQTLGEDEALLVLAQARGVARRAFAFDPGWPTWLERACGSSDGGEESRVVSVQERRPMIDRLAFDPPRRAASADPA